MNFSGEPEIDPLARKDWKVSTRTSLGQCCANCASTVNVEMHHLKHLKTMNTKLDSCTPLPPLPPPTVGERGQGGGGKMMASINRKQVPLCKPCHIKVHKGDYLGMSLQHFQHIK